MKRISSSNGFNPGNADKWAFPGLLYFIGNSAIAYLSLNIDIGRRHIAVYKWRYPISQEKVI
jgi:hypothetical protein